MCECVYHKRTHLLVSQWTPSRQSVPQSAHVIVKAPPIVEVFSNHGKVAGLGGNTLPRCLRLDQHFGQKTLSGLIPCAVSVGHIRSHPAQVKYVVSWCGDSGSFAVSVGADSVVVTGGVVFGGGRATGFLSPSVKIIDLIITMLYLFYRFFL